MDASLGSSGYGASTTDALNAAWLLCSGGFSGANQDFDPNQLPSGGIDPKRTPQDETRSEISRREKIERGENLWVSFAGHFRLYPANIIATYLQAEVG